MDIKHSDERSFNVKFYSRIVANSIGKPSRQTICKLATVDDTKLGKERYTNVAVGTVVRNHKDADSRPEGRDKAFGKAIQAFPKEERIKMWRQYNPTMQLEGEPEPVVAEVEEEATVEK